MLGKTAGGLYWMFRYLERAENTARLLDAGLRMALTRDVLTAEDHLGVLVEGRVQPGVERLGDGHRRHQRTSSNPAW